MLVKGRNQRKSNYMDYGYCKACETKQKANSELECEKCGQIVVLFTIKQVSLIEEVTRLLYSLEDSTMYELKEVSQAIALINKLN